MRDDWREDYEARVAALQEQFRAIPDGSNVLCATATTGS